MPVFQANELVWVRDGEEEELTSLELGRVIGAGESTGSFAVQLIDSQEEGATLEVPASRLRSALAVPDHRKADLLQLEDFSQEGIVHSLNRRFNQDIIYT